MTPGVAFTTLQFLHMLQMDQEARVLVNGQAFSPGVLYDCMQLIGHIRNLQRKKSVVNVTQGTVFTTPHFFVT